MRALRTLTFSLCDLRLSGLFLTRQKEVLSKLVVSLKPKSTVLTAANKLRHVRRRQCFDLSDVHHMVSTFSSIVNLSLLDSVAISTVQITATFVSIPWMAMKDRAFWTKISRYMFKYSSYRCGSEFWIDTFVFSANMPWWVSQRKQSTKARFSSKIVEQKLVGMRYPDGDRQPSHSVL